MLYGASLAAVAAVLLVVIALRRHRHQVRRADMSRPYSGPPRSSVRVLDRGEEEREAARRALRREEELQRRTEAHQARLRRMTG